MKILITGGAGFIGRWLVGRLPPDAAVVVIDSLEEQVHGPKPKFPPELLARAKCIRCDLRDGEKWKDDAVGTDVVVHLAALTGTGQSMYQQRRYIENNVLGTSELFEIISQLRPRPARIILASSRAVYGEGAYRDGDRVVHCGPRSATALACGRWELENSDGASLVPVPIREDAPLKPTSIYGMTKMWQEQLLALLAEVNGMEFLALRLQNIYGPLQSIANSYSGVMGVFASEIMKSGEIELFEDGQMTRDFIYVGDVAQGLVAAIYHPGHLKYTLNLGSGVRVSLREVISVLARIANKKPLVSCRGRYRQGDIRHAVADMDSYQKVFGALHLTTLEDGLGEYLRWFMKQPPPGGNALASSLAEMEHHGLLLAAQ